MSTATLCTYVVKYDQGFSPNPFGPYCTLAACTPNHQKIHLTKGDWILGHAEKSKGQGIIYIMEVKEVLDFEQYFADLRFAYKKPRPDKTWREQRGDNIYIKADGIWKQHPEALFHTDAGSIQQDTEANKVFISDHFYYFGDHAPAIPEPYAGLKWERLGTKKHDSEQARAFIEWVKTSFTPGCHGNPRDAGVDASCSGLENVC